MLQKNLLTSIFASVAPLRPSHASFGCTLHPHMQCGFYMHTLHAQFSNQSHRHGNDRSHARRPRVHGDKSTDELDQHPCCLDLNQCLCEHTARRARTGPISIRVAWTSICECAHIPIHDEHSGGQQQGSIPIGARIKKRGLQIDRGKKAKPPEMTILQGSYPSRKSSNKPRGIGPDAASHEATEVSVEAYCSAGHQLVVYLPAG